MARTPVKKKGAGGRTPVPRLKKPKAEEPITPTTPLEAKESATMSIPENVQPKELKKPEYFVVMFSPAQNENDPQDHHFTVGSEQKVIPRGVYTILHDKFLEVARNAVEEHLVQHRMADGTYSKKVKKIHTCPFTVAAPATREQYERFLKIGSRIARDNAEKYGKDAPSNEVLKEQSEKYFDPIIQECLNNAHTAGFKPMNYGEVARPWGM